MNEKKRQLSASVDDIKKEIKKYMTSESYLSTCFSDVVSRIRELGGDGLSLTSPLAMQADALDKIPAKSDHASYNQINLWYH